MKGAQSISTRRAYGVQRDLPRVGTGAVQRLRATARDEGARITAPRAGRCRPGRGAGRPHPPGARSLTVSWRGVPESVGEAAGRGDPHLEGAGAAVNAGARPPGPAPRGPRARPEGTRRHDHHGGPRCDVGNGHDGHGDHRRGVGRLCSWRSITVRPSASASMRPRAGAGSRPWSRSVRASANASAPLAKAWAHGLRLRHDHGSNYLADDFQQEVAFFGIESSPSFVREPEGNGVAERFIRTLKENVLWVRSFDTIEELRLALLEFKRTYNEHWMLERYDYRSPAQVRRDLVGLDAAA